MSTTTTVPPMKSFEITLMPLGGGPSSYTRPKRVEAAYFTRDDAFITFKDQSNKDVYAVQAGSVLSIERLAMSASQETTG